AERVRAWSLAACVQEITNVPEKFSSELIGTIEVAVGAASVALLAGCIFAWRARRGSWSVAPLVLLAVLGLTIPGPVVGAGLIQLFNHDLPPAIPLGDGTLKSWLLVLYDNTPLAPMIAQAIR